jgi:hypothetical protein
MISCYIVPYGWARILSPKKHKFLCYDIVSGRSYHISLSKSGSGFGGQLICIVPKSLIDCDIKKMAT